MSWEEQNDLHRRSINDILNDVPQGKGRLGSLWIRNPKRVEFLRRLGLTKYISPGKRVRASKHDAYHSRSFPENQDALDLLREEALQAEEKRLEALKVTQYRGFEDDRRQRRIVGRESQLPRNRVCPKCGRQIPGGIRRWIGGRRTLEPGRRWIAEYGIAGGTRRQVRIQPGKWVWEIRELQCLSCWRMTKAPTVEKPSQINSGADLRAARLHAKLSQRQLAERMSISQTMLQKHEKAERLPPCVCRWAETHFCIDRKPPSS